MLTDSEKAAIRTSWRLVIPIAETAADLFYRRLFELKPEYRQLFSMDMAAQKRKLLHMLAFVVKSLDYREAEWKDDVSAEEDLMLVVLALGRRHSELYKIPDESYDVVAEALIWTLHFGLGEAFTPEVQAAWVHVYTLLARTMRMGSATVDRDRALGSAAEAQAFGKQALQQQLGASGIDPMGREEDLS